MKNYAKNPKIVARMAEGERYLIPLTETLEGLKKLFKLNPMGWFIWQELDQSEDLEDLSRLIALEFDVSKETASRDARKFLDDLVRIGALLTGEAKSDET
ncbi:MAG: PqqD family protein [Pseudomonadota bacterium]